MRACPALFVSCLLVLAGGCTPAFGPQAANGITFYCPGAGNIDFGDAGIRDGLQKAGYRGQVATVMWTVSFNPAIDQALRINARLGGQALAQRIEQYLKEYPGREVNLIGLSAGTGVAIWALEELKGERQVDNVVLLGSSLWHRYDVGKAATHVKGKIYNYYSSSDAVLAGPMKLFGTIDGVFGEEGAGAVGLHSPRGREQVVNIRWRPEYRRYGYHGGHMDSTSPGFVRAFLAKHIMAEPTAGLPDGKPATAAETIARAGPRD